MEDPDGRLPARLGAAALLKVWDWQGELQMREAQSHAWQTIPVDVVPVLPGTIPVLAWLAQERGFSGPTHA